MSAQDRMKGILAIEAEQARLAAEHAREVKHLKIDLNVKTESEARAALAFFREEQATVVSSPPAADEVKP